MEWSIKSGVVGCEEGWRVGCEEVGGVIWRIGSGGDCGAECRVMGGAGWRVCGRVGRGYDELCRIFIDIYEIIFIILNIDY